MENSIFYFTGTGNSLKIAKDMGNKLSNCNIVSIAKNYSNVNVLEPKGIVGFVFPVFYCGLPKIVDEFINKINLSNASYVFVIAVYGATGGNGGCSQQSKSIFSDKNIKLNSFFYIKSVDNFNVWTLKGDIPSLKKQKEIHENVTNSVNIISEIILNKKKHFDKSFIEYIGPIIYGYKHFIKTVKERDKYFTVGNNCNSCGLCVKICPTKNIQMEEKPKWLNENCQFCLGCLHLCPKKAINYKKVTLKRNRYRNPFIELEEFNN